LSLANNRTLVLEGRLDRVDQHKQDDCFAVLDYKTLSVAQLKKKLGTLGEDIQLPVYAKLLGDKVGAAAYLSLDKEKVSADVGIESDIDQLTEDVIQRLCHVFAMLYDGAKLRAQGIEQDCEFCEMRGLCRKDYWA
jgi:ATP-dependent helicase/nuclease subunit B